MDVQSSLVTGESVVVRSSKHWIAPLVDSKWAALEILIALVLTWLQTGDTSGILGFFNRVLALINVVLVVSALGWIVYNIVAWRTAEYYVTNRRVLGTEGLVRRRSTDTVLTSVSDVRLSVSFLGRALGFGNLKILTSSGDPGADTFTAMRDVEAFKKQIIEQKMGAAALTEARGGAAPTLPRGASIPATATVADTTNTIGELARLRDAGAITTEEFETKKAELLSRI
jgi:uncharacterized membrane protein YdbT with pleckstrin-like domain